MHEIPQDVSILCSPVTEEQISTSGLDSCTQRLLGTVDSQPLLLHEPEAAWLSIVLGAANQRACLGQHRQTGRRDLRMVSIGPKKMDKARASLVPSLCSLPPNPRCARRKDVAPRFWASLWARVAEANQSTTETASPGTKNPHVQTHPYMCTDTHVHTHMHNTYMTYMHTDPRRRQVPTAVA